MTTKDIIQRAKQIADLENSDFISSSEEKALLNESYLFVYNQMINNGDLYYLSSISLGGTGVYNLPDDLYQVYCVKDRLGAIIPRLPKNHSVSSTGYIIRNGCIELINVIDGVILEYFPKPEILDIEVETQELPRVGDVLLDVAGEDYLSTDNSRLALYVGDTLYYTFTTHTIVHGYIDEKTIVILHDDDTITVFNRLDNNIVANDIIDTAIVKTENRLYLIQHSKVVDPLNTAIVIRDCPITTIDSNTLYSFNDEQWFSYTGTIIKDAVTNEILESYAQENQVPGCINGCYSYRKQIEQSNVLFLGYNNNTYYSTYNQNYIFVDNDATNTLLDYPSNMFYSYLAYRLALSYKIKQQADVSSFMYLVEQAESQFFDTLSNDDNSPVRITNVKGGGGLLWY